MKRHNAIRNWKQDEEYRGRMSEIRKRSHSRRRLLEVNSDETDEKSNEYNVDEPNQDGDDTKTDREASKHDGNESPPGNNSDSSENIDMPPISGNCARGYYVHQ